MDTSMKSIEHLERAVPVECIECPVFLSKQSEYQSKIGTAAISQFNILPIIPLVSALRQWRAGRSYTNFLRSHIERGAHCGGVLPVDGDPEIGIDQCGVEVMDGLMNEINREQGNV